MYNQIDSNKRLSAAMIFIFLCLTIAVGWMFSWYYENSFILYIICAIAVFQAFASYWWSDKISLAFSGAKEAPRNEYIKFHRSVENMAITAGLPKPRVYVINDPSPNAFATGRDPKHAAIAATTGLLNILDKTELEGVIAHEMSHIGNRDTLVMTIAVVLVSVIAILSDWFIRIRWFGGRRREGGSAIAIIGIVFMILVPIIAQIIQLAISRKREYLADASGALLTRYPEGLAKALEKISKDPNPLKRASTATAHLYISNPFKSDAWMSKLFSTHPLVEDRIKKLREMIGK